MTVEQYIDSINRRFKQGNATEHSFRGDLQQLIESLVPGIRATNEPKRQTCGAPDYILTKGDIPIGFIEAKDIGDKDLDGTKKTGNKEQFDRYKASLGNLMFTDYLNFHLYRDGEFVTKIAIAELTASGIVAQYKSFDAFTNLIKDFSTHVGQTIKSSKKLAQMMAGKARLLSDVIEKSLTSDEDNHQDSTLKDQMIAFRKILIHDITPKGFADVYAQTIAYGLFAARLHDPTLPTFSRSEAAELIPKSNPFLRKLFGYIAGPDIDDRIKWIVDSLVEIFLACNVEELLKNYGKSTKTEDPIIHFYETFLSEYDPKLRKARGVWYTPQPVVNFIVRAVDDILKTEFGLPQGLADNSKTKIKLNLQETDKRFKGNIKTIEQEVHKVQILDPATGTGTFLAEVIKQIHKKFEGQQGIWSNYVATHLLPRLNGFELLMASYAMAHLQLDLLLKETGYKSTTNQRFKVFLTNSLEEQHPDTGTLFANWLSEEANDANRIKRETPVMCVIGNPPYAVSSSNKGLWIEKLLVDYKKNLTERNIQPLSDDYIKFLRYSQYFIERNGQGLVVMITNNSFIDGLSHRQMRSHLLETFDKIYILDLHGSAKKNETAKDGSKDENVFDIQQGVSISLFIKTSTPKKKGKVFHYELYGSREQKYEELISHSVNQIKWQELTPNEPNMFFVPKDFMGEAAYKEYFSVGDVFINYGCGTQTKRDLLFVDFEEEALKGKIKKLLSAGFTPAEKEHYNIQNSSSYRLIERAQDCTYQENKIRKYNYRVFDDRYIYYDENLLGRPFFKVMEPMIKGENIALLVCRQQSTFDFQHCFITKLITDHNSISLQTKEASYEMPLYVFPKGREKLTLENVANDRTPNLNQTIVKQISEGLDLTFTPEKETTANTFAPIDILDYIYAVLHIPTYREKYKEFLKIDFPRVPYPKDASNFWQLVQLGGELRGIHLLESPVVDNYITQYSIDGDNIVTKIRFEENYEIIDGETISLINPVYPMGRVYINDTQFFQMVPKVAWEFYIGGYQPAQKWLKDRKGRELQFEDILHYQKIILALFETDRIMKEIDKIEIE